MEWIDSISEAIEYIENNIYSEINTEKICNHVNISPFYFQKSFAIMTGLTLGEYVRNRRLYLAALDLTSTQNKIIDIAFKYGYETPESFTKAFTRFHGVTPSQIREHTEKIHLFLPLKIHVEIIGGNDMDVKIEKMESFKVIGFEKSFSFETSYKEIPLFWDEVFTKFKGLFNGKKEALTELEKAFLENSIGELGICIDDGNKKEFKYIIGGFYHGGEVPQGMTIYELPAKQWAKFDIVGPLPGALQSVNTKIFKEWIPNNKKYTIDGGFDIEWYSPKGMPSDSNYQSAIWIPVKIIEK